MNRASLFRRIEKLEQSRPVKQKRADSAAPRIISILTNAGFARADNESWAEVCARALGITPHELRAELMRRGGVRQLPK